MLDRETKIKNTIIGRFMALFVAGVVCLMQAIPVFADDETKALVDFNTVNLNIATDNTSYYTDYSYDDIVVPVYIYITTNVNVNYYSGYVTGSYNAFNYTDGNSNRLVITYFESTNEYVKAKYNRTTNVWNITFDNFQYYSSQSVPIGYMHLMTSSQDTSITITCNNYTQNLNITNNALYRTGYEYGYVNAMIYALNNSANVEDMLSILNSIDANMLPEILTVMRSNHTALYNLIQNVWTTDQAVLSVDRNIYNTVLSILGILEDAYSPQASQAEDIKEDVEQNLSNLISDIELTKPSQVANIADDYIAQIDTSYNNLAFGFLSNNTIVLMLCIVAGLAIISYMLYGGQ